MDWQVEAGKKCPFYANSSSKYPRLKCMHYHSGREWVEFSDRSELRVWKDALCFGDFRACKYFPANVGRDTEFEDAWIVVVSYAGKEYWKRAVSDRVLRKAINEILADVFVYDPDNQSTRLNIKVDALHSSDPRFNELLSDLQFAGVRLGDTREGW